MFLNRFALPIIVAACASSANALAKEAPGVAFNGQELSAQAFCDSTYAPIVISKGKEVLARYQHDSKAECIAESNKIAPAIAQNQIIVLRASDFQIKSRSASCAIDSSRVLEIDQTIVVKGRSTDSSTSQKIAKEFKSRFGKTQSFEGLTGRYVPGTRSSYEDSKGYVDLQDTGLDYLVQGLSFGLFGLTGYSKGSTHYTQVGVLFELDEAGHRQYMCKQARECVTDSPNRQAYDFAVEKGRYLGCWN